MTCHHLQVIAGRFSYGPLDMAALSSELVDLHIMKVLYYRPTEGIVLRSQVINSLLYFAQRKGKIYIVKPFNHEMRRGMPNKSLRL